MPNWREILKKRILIYGTGINAKQFVEEHEEAQIVGVIDRVKFEGDFCGIPILMWKDVEEGMADAIIIASSPKYYSEICKRIIYICLKMGIKIYGKNGEHLGEKYLLCRGNRKQAAYYQKSKNDLLKQIDKHEAISFDVFDTLVMRKVLEPADVFDLVEKELNEKGITADGFKRKRRTAELEAKGGNIYIIYERLALYYSWTEEEKNTALCQELECEKRVLVQREEMVQVMNYAVKQGKKVSLISDMYIPEKILGELLAELGITGYEKLYVSCDYGKGKGSGLFNIYKNDVVATSYLHIGDNYEADCVSAQKSQIYYYEILSALDMTKVSNLSFVLLEAEENRFFLGKALASIFNDPFALHNTSGIVTFTKVSMAACLFWMPCVIKYLNTLLKTVQEDKYKGILFSARDGYYIYRLFEKYCKPKLSEEIDLVYFYTSRLLALKATIEKEEDLLPVADYLGEQIDSVFKKMFRTSNYCKEAQETRENYLHYFQKNQIDLNQKYIICDLVSSGTVQGALNNLFNVDLKGVYLKEIQRKNRFDVEVESAIKTEDNALWRDPIVFLEKVFTAPHPSIKDMGKAGIPIYAEETRNKEEIRDIECIQKNIQDELEDVQKTFGTSFHITDECLMMILTAYNEFNYAGELNFVNNWKIVDDMSGNVFSVV